jgi:DNA-binding CsgD family transcriptional regulator/type II secretory pathway predicted ATPase ExeA
VSNTRVFVGRGSELRALAALVEDARRGPSVGVVLGDPGSGKTRLLREVTATFQVDRRFDVVGFEPERNVPLAAAATMLRSLGQTGTALRRLLTTDVGVLEPVQVFEAALRVFGSDEPTLIVIDDLQWLDELSLALCHYLVRGAASERQPLALLASSRPSREADSLMRSLAALLGNDRVTQLELGPLDDEAANELLLALAPGLDAAGLERRRLRAAGSPFWLEALARSEETAADEHRLLTSRLRGASADASALLSLLAVAGRPLSPEEATAVLRWSPSRADNATAELVGRGVVVHRGMLLHPAHDLIREAAGSELPQRRRRELHRQLAEHLEAVAQGDLRLLREALEHRLAGGLPANSLAEQLVRSPQRTLLGTDGLAALTSIFETSEAGTGPLGLGLARLAFEDAERLGQAAASRLSGGDRADALLAAARGAFERHDGERAQTLLKDARGVLESDPVGALEADALEAMTCLWIEGRQEDGQRLAQGLVPRTRRLIESSGGHATLSPRERRACATTLEAAVGAAMQADHADELLRLVDEEEALSDALDVSIVFHRTYGLRHSGRFREAADAAREAWRAATRRVLPHVALEAGVVLAQTLHDLGHLEEAEQVASEVRPLGERLRVTSYRTPAVSRLQAEIESLRGDWRHALDQLAANVETTADPHYRIGEHEVIALLLARLGGPTEHEHVVRRLELASADSDLAGCPRCARQLQLASAYALAKVGRPGEGRGFLDESGIEDAVGASWRIYHRLRASAAIAAAERDASAVDASRAAWVEAGRLELRVEEVWQRLDEAELLDGPDAVTALRAAGELADEIGSRTQAEVARQRLRARGIRTWKRRGVRDAALTERELEIARLVAAGESNPEIAARLFLSRKTVERHVSNALRKLGARNRAELAARVASLEDAGVAR